MTIAVDFHRFEPRPTRISAEARRAAVDCLLHAIGTPLTSGEAAMVVGYAAARLERGEIAGAIGTLTIACDLTGAYRLVAVLETSEGEGNVSALVDPGNIPEVDVTAEGEALRALEKVLHGIQGGDVQVVKGILSGLHKDGYNEGWQEGYDEGYDTGQDEGYTSGYEDASPDD